MTLVQKDKYIGWKITAWLGLVILLLVAAMMLPPLGLLFAFVALFVAGVGSTYLWNACVPVSQDGEPDAHGRPDPINIGVRVGLMLVSLVGVMVLPIVWNLVSLMVFCFLVGSGAQKLFAMCTTQDKREEQDSVELETRGNTAKTQSALEQTDGMQIFPSPVGMDPGAYTNASAPPSDELEKLVDPNTPRLG